MRRLRDRGGPAQGTRYTMREKMLAIGDDAWIETDGGDRAFKVNGKAMRVRDTVVLELPSGDELFTIQEKKLTVRDRMEVERDGKTVATVKKALVGLTSASATATRWPRSRSDGSARGTPTG
jgi:uncharacterized protein YxjI